LWSRLSSGQGNEEQATTEKDASDPRETKVAAYGGHLIAARLSGAALVFVPFPSIVMFNIIGQFRQGFFDELNEIPATGSHSTEGNDGIAFGLIISNSKNLTIWLESMGSTLDEVIGGLTGTGVNDLQFGGGERLRSARRGAATVKENGDGRAHGVTIEL
jgi:hypothetical protein